MMTLGTGLKPAVTTHHHVALGSNRLVPAALWAAKSGREWCNRHDIPQKKLHFGPPYHSDGAMSAAGLTDLYWNVAPFQWCTCKESHQLFMVVL